MAVSPTNSDKFGIALDPDAFRVRTLAGDYLLSYTTWFGTFYVPFRAFEPARITIGLQPRDMVLNVSLHPGTIADISQETTLGNGEVIVMSWPGSSTTIAWQDIFSLNLAASVVTLVQGGVVVESDLVEDLTGGASNTYGVYIRGWEAPIICGPG